MALDAGSVFVTLGGRFNPGAFDAFGAGVGKATGQMRAAEAEITASQSRLAASSQRSSLASSAAFAKMGTAARTGAAGAVVALAAATVQSIKAAANFNKEIDRTRALGGQYAKRIDEMAEASRQLGLKTGVGATKAAEAIEALAKGGLSASQILSGGLEGAIALAQAGTMDLGQAAETTANALNLFGLDGDKAAHVADVLAQAAQATTADVSDFALALSQGGGAAKAAGLSFDQTVVALEALALTGVKGSDAGTSLKAAFAQIVNPSKQSGAAMRKLGLDFFDAQGKIKPIPALADMLRSKLHGLTQEQRLATLQTIAGTDGFRALLALYDQGGAKLEKIAAGHRKSGTAAKVAAEQQDNLSGGVARLGASFQEIGIAIGDRFQKPLQHAADWMAKFIGQMAAGEGAGGTLVAVLAKVAQVVGFTFAAPLRVISTMIGAVKLLADAFNFLPGPDIPTGGLEKAKKMVDGLVDKLQVDHFTLDLQVNADGSAAKKALREIAGTKIAPKVAKILTSGDTSSKQKIQALQDLGIDAKTARIIVAGIPQTLAGIAAVQSAMGGLPASKTVTLTTVNRILNEGSSVSKTPPVKLGKKRAIGRGAGDAETALVGEGLGGELVGNQDSGWTWIDKPTVMGLAPGDYVIPTDPAYAGRALGFMLGALGIPGYAKGKKPGKKPSAKALPIPDQVTFGAVPEDDLNSQKDAAREAYQKRKDRVHNIDVDLREQRKKVAEAKGPAKRKAQRKLSDLQRDRHRYNDGGDGLASLATLRKHWQELSDQARVLHKTNLEIDRLNTIQETDRQKMENAAKRGDAGAWGLAKKDRDAVLASLRDKYGKAVALAKPGTNFAAELEGKLAGVEGEIADAAGDVFEAASPFDGGMTAAEKKRLDELQAAQSLAALTTGLGDDQAAAVATEQFLTGLLGAALNDPSRGGASVIGALADQVKQARDNVASFTSGATGTTNDNPDLQAQLDQQRTRADVATRAAEISDRALSVFQGAGDIGMAPNITINTLHPGDPQTLAAIGGAAVAGMSQQAFVTSPRTTLGL